MGRIRSLWNVLNESFELSGQGKRKAVRLRSRRHLTIGIKFTFRVMETPVRYNWHFAIALISDGSDQLLVFTHAAVGCIAVAIETIHALHTSARLLSAGGLTTPRMHQSSMAIFWPVEFLDRAPPHSLAGVDSSDVPRLGNDRTYASRLRSRRDAWFGKVTVQKPPLIDSKTICKFVSRAPRNLC